MKNFKYFKFSLTLLFIGNITNAQSDHLSPLNDIFAIYKYQFEYYSKVRTILFNGLSDRPEIRFLIMPSFTPENVLDIEFDRKNNKYFIVHNICEKMIWSNENWNQSKVLTYKKGISKESVDLIKALFKIAISKTRYSDDGLLGVDGENYQFSINDYGIKTGHVWSPGKGSYMYRLVDIGLQLIELTKYNENPVRLSDKLIKEITDLSNDIKNNDR